MCKSVKRSDPHHKTRTAGAIVVVTVLSKLRQRDRSTGLVAESRPSLQQADGVAGLCVVDFAARRVRTRKDSNYAVRITEAAGRPRLRWSAPRRIRQRWASSDAAEAFVFWKMGRRRSRNLRSGSPHRTGDSQA